MNILGKPLKRMKITIIILYLVAIAFFGYYLLPRKLIVISNIDDATIFINCNKCGRKMSIEPNSKAYEKIVELNNRGGWVCANCYEKRLYK